MHVANVQGDPMPPEGSPGEGWSGRGDRRRESADHRLMREEWLASETRYRTLTEQLQVGVIIQSAAAEILMSNAKALDLLGLTEEQLLGRTSLDPEWNIIHEDGSPFPGPTHPVPVAIATGRPVRQVVMGVFRPSVQDRVWLLVDAIPQLNDDGSVRQVVCTFADITAYRSALMAHRESERFASAMANTIPDLLAFWTTDLRCGFANEAYLRWFGRTAEDMKDITLRELLGERLFEQNRPFVEGALQGKAQGFERVLVDQEGHARHTWAQYLPYLSEGVLKGFFALVTDVTAVKEPQERLRQSEAFTRSILDSMRDLVVVLDAESRIRSVNQAWRTFAQRAGLESLGRSASDPWMGLSFPDAWMAFPLVPEEIRAEACLGLRQVSSGQRPSFEQTYPCRLGQEERWFRLSATPLGTQEGGAVLVHADVTEQRQAEQRERQLEAHFQQVQKMESLGVLASGVAHDMNNVLGAILGLASANLDKVPEGSAQGRAFQIILQATERGRDVVKRLLSFARTAPSEPCPLDLNALLREEAHLLERTTLARVQIEMDLQSQLPPIRGEAASLSHAFMNLCVNAVDAMPEGGILRFRSRQAEPGWVEIQIEDTGTGMTEDVRQRAMDPFFTTKEPGKGTGLGLAMVYATMQAHQGRIEIQSEPGRGTSVRLRFPTSPDAVVPRAPAHANTRSGEMICLSILVVDDDELVQSSMEGVLEALGHATTICARGEEALARLKEGLSPDLVLLDMNMPGLGGAATLRSIRESHPDLPVLLTTGRADQTALDLAAAHPKVTLLAKPFSLEELRRCIEALQSP